MRRAMIAAVALALLATGTQAQTDPAAAPTNAVHRTTLQEQPFPVPRYHTVTVKTVIDPGGTIGAHTHPGAEMAYVDNGSATLMVAGQPPRNLTVGDSFSIAQGTVHALANAGSGPLTVISTYVVERGQPIAIPAK